MTSFDVVSKFNIQEIENSVNMVNRDIVNRFDFRGSNTKLTLNKNKPPPLSGDLNLNALFTIICVQNSNILKRLTKDLTFQKTIR